MRTVVAGVVWATVYIADGECVHCIDLIYAVNCGQQEKQFFMGDRIQGLARNRGDRPVETGSGIVDAGNRLFSMRDQNPTYGGRALENTGETERNGHVWLR